MDHQQYEGVANTTRRRSTRNPPEPTFSTYDWRSMAWGSDSMQIDHWPSARCPISTGSALPRAQVQLATPPMTLGTIG